MHDQYSRSMVVVGSTFGKLKPMSIPKFAIHLVCLAICFQPIAGSAQTRATVTVNVTPGHPTNRFIPSRALGAGVDGHPDHEIPRLLTRPNIKSMLSTGFKSLTYRLRTELAGEAWHWNPSGSWSDQAHNQGYWVSSGKPGAPIHLSYGYHLPRRGNTLDQADNNGYSRIDDGKPDTFWKSNPYLDEYYTGEKYSASPQWVIIDLNGEKPVDAIRILWDEPFATDYTVEFGEYVGNEDMGQRLPSEWHTFPKGNIAGGKGGNTVIRLADAPSAIKYIRIRLNQSSGTGPKTSSDIRDRLGFAIREIYLGTLDAAGKFHDVIDHGITRKTQTDIYVSSTDPWHRAIDRDPQTEQPGFDFIYQTGLTNGLPMLVPVPILFDTPENASAEIQYLKAKGYSFERVELGEEPDGQFMTPEQYGALYLQWEKAIHKVDPSLKLGGPSLQDIELTEVPGRLEFGKGGWMGRFIDYMKRHDQLDKFTFFSFEWYPFPDDCNPRQLVKTSTKLTDQMNELEKAGLPRNIPWIITEYGYSAFGTRTEIDLDGALFNADSVGRFLTLGGETAYLYGYEPGEAIKEQDCSSGNNMLFFRDDNLRITKPSATYWGARMLTQEWVKPGNEANEIYPAASDVINPENYPIITAYALKRPDGLWSVMLINGDMDKTFEVNTVFHNGSTGQTAGFTGPLDVYQFSTGQYVLGGTATNPKPLKSDPPEHRIIQASSLQTGPIKLPPRSMTIVRGALDPGFGK